jgi:hypothetical protein
MYCGHRLYDVAVARTAIPQGHHGSNNSADAAVQSGFVRHLRGRSACYHRGAWVTIGGWLISLVWLAHYSLPPYKRRLEFEGDHFVSAENRGDVQCFLVHAKDKAGSRIAASPHAPVALIPGAQRKLADLSADA